MHYANGREAKVGDLVRGKGYNIKHEIIGVVVATTPGTDTCNIEVACVGIKRDVPIYADVAAGFVDGKVVTFDGSANVRVHAVREYGQADAFVALDPETGEVLPPT